MNFDHVFGDFEDASQIASEAWRDDQRAQLIEALEAVAEKVPPMLEHLRQGGAF